MTLLITSAENFEVRNTSHKDIHEVLLPNKAFVIYEVFYDDKVRTIKNTPCVVTDVRSFQVCQVFGDGTKMYSSKFE